MTSPAPSLSKFRRPAAWLFFGIGALFWPFFIGITAIELHWSLGWFSSENELFWGALALVALLCMAIAPFFSQLCWWRKLIAAVFCVILYGLEWVVAILIGVRYLQWSPVE